jgi:hypothetical protein
VHEFDAVLEHPDRALAEPTDSASERKQQESNAHASLVH